mmetsp:Transcript_10793/g.34346  ORF Transcript_10793/g.34346 Transcript_10793/m.34346 type:complete len:352 (-) Transcript_10793:263-1318(-)
MVDHGTTVRGQQRSRVEHRIGRLLRDVHASDRAQTGAGPRGCPRATGGDSPCPVAATAHPASGSARLLVFLVWCPRGAKSLGDAGGTGERRSFVLCFGSRRTALAHGARAATAESRQRAAQRGGVVREPPIDGLPDLLRHTAVTLRVLGVEEEDEAMEEAAASKQHDAEGASEELALARVAHDGVDLIDPKDDDGEDDSGRVSGDADSRHAKAALRVGIPGVLDAIQHEGEDARVVVPNEDGHHQKWAVHNADAPNVLVVTCNPAHVAVLCGRIHGLAPRVAQEREEGDKQGANPDHKVRQHVALLEAASGAPAGNGAQQRRPQRHPGSDFLIHVLRDNEMPEEARSDCKG